MKKGIQWRWILAAISFAINGMLVASVQIAHTTIEYDFNNRIKHKLEKSRQSQEVTEQTRDIATPVDGITGDAVMVGESILVGSGIVHKSEAALLRYSLDFDKDGNVVLARTPLALSSGPLFGQKIDRLIVTDSRVPVVLANRALYLMLDDEGSRIASMVGSLRDATNREIDSAPVALGLLHDDSTDAATLFAAVADGSGLPPDVTLGSVDIKELFNQSVQEVASLSTGKAKLQSAARLMGTTAQEFADDIQPLVQQGVNNAISVSYKKDNFEAAKIVSQQINDQTIVQPMVTRAAQALVPLFSDDVNNGVSAEWVKQVVTFVNGVDALASLRTSLLIERALSLLSTSNLAVLFPSFEQGEIVPLLDKEALSHIAMAATTKDAIQFLTEKALLATADNSKAIVALLYVALGWGLKNVQGTSDSIEEIKTSLRSPLAQLENGQFSPDQKLIIKGIRTNTEWLTAVASLIQQSLQLPDDYVEAGARALTASLGWGFLHTSGASINDGAIKKLLTDKTGSASGMIDLLAKDRLLMQGSKMRTVVEALQGDASFLASVIDIVKQAVGMRTAFAAEEVQVSLDDIAQLAAKTIKNVVGYEVADALHKDFFLAASQAISGEALVGVFPSLQQVLSTSQVVPIALTAAAGWALSNTRKMSATLDEDIKGYFVQALEHIEQALTLESTSRLAVTAMKNWAVQELVPTLHKSVEQRVDRAIEQLHDQLKMHDSTSLALLAAHVIAPELLQEIKENIQPIHAEILANVVLSGSTQDKKFIEILPAERQDSIVSVAALIEAIGGWGARTLRSRGVGEDKGTYLETLKHMLITTATALEGAAGKQEKPLVQEAITLFKNPDDRFIEQVVKIFTQILNKRIEQSAELAYTRMKSSNTLEVAVNGTQDFFTKIISQQITAQQVLSAAALPQIDTSLIDGSQSSAAIGMGNATSVALGNLLRTTLPRLGTMTPVTYEQAVVAKVRDVFDKIKIASSPIVQRAIDAVTQDTTDGSVVSQLARTVRQGAITRTQLSGQLLQQFLQQQAEAGLLSSLLQQIQDLFTAEIVGQLVPDEQLQIAFVSEARSRAISLPTLSDLFVPVGTSDSYSMAAARLAQSALLWGLRNANMALVENQQVDQTLSRYFDESMDSLAQSFKENALVAKGNIKGDVALYAALGSLLKETLKKQLDDLVILIKPLLANKSQEIVVETASVIAGMLTGDVAGMLSIDKTKQLLDARNTEQIASLLVTVKDTGDSSLLGVATALEAVVGWVGVQAGSVSSDAELAEFVQEGLSAVEGLFSQHNKQLAKQAVEKLKTSEPLLSLIKQLVKPLLEQRKNMFLERLLSPELLTGTIDNALRIAQAPIRQEVNAGIRSEQIKQAVQSGQPLAQLAQTQGNDVFVGTSTALEGGIVAGLRRSSQIGHADVITSIDQGINDVIAGFSSAKNSSQQGARLILDNSVIKQQLGTYLSTALSGRTNVIVPAMLGKGQELAASVFPVVQELYSDDIFASVTGTALDKPTNAVGIDSPNSAAFASLFVSSTSPDDYAFGFGLAVNAGIGWALSRLTLVMGQDAIRNAIIGGMQGLRTALASKPKTLAGVEQVLKADEIITILVAKVVAVQNELKRQLLQDINQKVKNHVVPQAAQMVSTTAAQGNLLAVEGSRVDSEVIRAIMNINQADAVSSLLKSVEVVVASLGDVDSYEVGIKGAMTAALGWLLRQNIAQLTELSLLIHVREVVVQLIAKFNERDFSLAAQAARAFISNTSLSQKLFAVINDFKVIIQGAKNSLIDAINKNSAQILVKGQSAVRRIYPRDEIAAQVGAGGIFNKAQAIKNASGGNTLDGVVRRARSEVAPLNVASLSARQTIDWIIISGYAWLSRQVTYEFSDIVSLLKQAIEEVKAQALNDTERKVAEAFLQEHEKFASDNAILEMAKTVHGVFRAQSRNFAEKLKEIVAGVVFNVLIQTEEQQEVALNPDDIASLINISNPQVVLANTEVAGVSFALEKVANAVAQRLFAGISDEAIRLHIVEQFDLSEKAASGHALALQAIRKLKENQEFITHLGGFLKDALMDILALQGSPIADAVTQDAQLKTAFFSILAALVPQHVAQLLPSVDDGLSLAQNATVQSFIEALRAANKEDSYEQGIANVLNCVMVWVAVSASVDTTLDQLDTIFRQVLTALAQAVSLDSAIKQVVEAIASPEQQSLRLQLLTPMHEQLKTATVAQVDAIVTSVRSEVLDQLIPKLTPAVREYVTQWATLARVKESSNKQLLTEQLQLSFSGGNGLQNGVALGVAISLSRLGSQDALKTNYLSVLEQVAHELASPDVVGSNGKAFSMARSIVQDAALTTLQQKAADQASRAASEEFVAQGVQQLQGGTKNILTTVISLLQPETVQRIVTGFTTLFPSAASKTLQELPGFIVPLLDKSLEDAMVGVLTLMAHQALRTMNVETSNAQLIEAMQRVVTQLESLLPSTSLTGKQAVEYVKQALNDGENKLVIALRNLVASQWDITIQQASKTIMSVLKNVTPVRALGVSATQLITRLQAIITPLIEQQLITYVQKNHDVETDIADGDLITLQASVQKTVSQSEGQPLQQALARTVAGMLAWVGRNSTKDFTAQAFKEHILSWLQEAAQQAQSAPYKQLIEIVKRFIEVETGNSAVISLMTVLPDTADQATTGAISQTLATVSLVQNLTAAIERGLRVVVLDEIKKLVASKNLVSSIAAYAPADEESVIAHAMNTLTQPSNVLLSSEAEGIVALLQGALGWAVRNSLPDDNVATIKPLLGVGAQASLTKMEGQAAAIASVLQNAGDVFSSLAMLTQSSVREAAQQQARAFTKDISNGGNDAFINAIISVLGPIAGKQIAQEVAALQDGSLQLASRAATLQELLPAASPEKMRTSFSTIALLMQFIFGWATSNATIHDATLNPRFDEVLQAIDVSENAKRIAALLSSSEQGLLLLQAMDSNVRKAVAHATRLVAQEMPLSIRAEQPLLARTVEVVQDPLGKDLAQLLKADTSSIATIAQETTIAGAVSKASSVTNSSLDAARGAVQVALGWGTRAIASAMSLAEIKALAAASFAPLQATLSGKNYAQNAVTAMVADDALLNGIASSLQGAHHQAMLRVAEKTNDIIASSQAPNLTANAMVPLIAQDIAAVIKSPRLLAAAADPVNSSQDAAQLVLQDDENPLADSYVAGAAAVLETGVGRSIHELNAVTTVEPIEPRQWQTGAKGGDNRGVCVIRQDGDTLRVVGHGADDRAFKLSLLPKIGGGDGTVVSFANGANGMATALLNSGVALRSSKAYPNTLFIGLSGVSRGDATQQPSNKEGGVVSLLVANLDPATKKIAKISPIIANPTPAMFNDNSDQHLLGFYATETAPASLAASVHDFQVMRTSTGKDYVIMLGGVDADSDKTHSLVHALPLMPAGSTHAGKLANRTITDIAKDSTSLPAVDKQHRIHDLTEAELPYVVGGDYRLLTKNSLLRITHMQLIGDFVYVSVAGNRAENNDEVGIFASRALFDEAGVIRRWTPWTRVMGEVEPVIFFGLDKESSNFWYITHDASGDDVVKVTQWGAGDIGVDQVHEGFPLSEAMDEVFKDAGGIFGLTAFDMFTPGFKSFDVQTEWPYFSMLAVMGKERLALVQTGARDEKGLFNQTRKFELGKTVFAFSDAVLQELGILFVAEFSRRREADQGWLFVGGQTGLAVLRKQDGSGFDGNQGLTQLSSAASESFPAGSGWSFKTLQTEAGDNPFIDVRKLVADGKAGYLYVLTKTALYRLSMKATYFKDGIIPSGSDGLITLASTDQTSVFSASSELLDLLLVNSDRDTGTTTLLLGTTEGLFVNQAATLPDVIDAATFSVKWVSVTTTQGDPLGAVVKMQAHSGDFADTSLLDKKNIFFDGNIEVLATDQAYRAVSVYRFTASQGVVRPIAEPYFVAGKPASFFYKVGDLLQGRPLLGPLALRGDSTVNAIKIIPDPDSFYNVQAVDLGMRIGTTLPFTPLGYDSASGTSLLFGAQMTVNE